MVRPDKFLFSSLNRRRFRDFLTLPRGRLVLLALLFTLRWGFAGSLTCDALLSAGAPGFFERCRDQIVAWPAAVKKREHVKVGVTLAYNLDASFIFQACEFGHDKVLLGHTHIAIIDIERETGRVWWRIDVTALRFTLRNAC